MSNLVYGDPFGAMVRGQQAGGAIVARRLQNQDTARENAYKTWYDPLRQAEAQSQVGGNLLKQMAAVAHYSGDYTAYNRVLAHYLGVPPEALPPGYAQGKGTASQTKAADLASGLLPVPLSYPGVIAAGGAYQALPSGPAQQGTGDPEIDALTRAYRIKTLQDAVNGVPPGGSGAVVPHMNPLAGIPQAAPTTAQGATLPQKIEPIWGDQGQMPPSPADLYGLPKPQRAAGAPMSPWEDEYQAPKQESTDGTE